MAERKLRNRRKPASKGQLIRVSDLVFKTLEAKRQQRMGWDAFLRKLLGLPDRAGNEQPLVEGFLEVTTGKFFLKLPGVSWTRLEEDAYETAIIAAARARTKRVNKPVRLREVV